MDDRTPLGREDGLVHVGGLRRPDGVDGARALVVCLRVRLGGVVVASSHGAGLKGLVVRVLLHGVVHLLLLVVRVLHRHLLL